jgi:hypothetical protein
MNTGIFIFNLSPFCICQKTATIGAWGWAKVDYLYLVSPDGNTSNGLFRERIDLFGLRHDGNV